MFIDDSRYANVVDPITLIAATTGIASTLAQVGDAKQRRQLETNLALLDANRKEALEKQLQRTKSANERLAILVSTLSQMKVAQTSAKLQAKAKREMTIAIVAVGGAIVLLIAIAILRK